MSVLIKGMKMPTHCDLCDFTTWDSNAGESRCFFTGNYTSASYDLLHGDCPLVPFPPHGRLIDADKFLALCREYAITPGDDEFCKRLEYALTKAPTIIPASEEGK